MIPLILEVCSNYSEGVIYLLVYLFIYLFCFVLPELTQKKERRQWTGITSLQTWRNRLRDQIPDQNARWGEYLVSAGRPFTRICGGFLPLHSLRSVSFNAAIEGPFTQMTELERHRLCFQTGALIRGAGRFLDEPRRLLPAVSVFVFRFSCTL